MESNHFDKYDAPEGAEKTAGNHFDKYDEKPEPPARGFKGWAQDIGATAVKGAIGVPEALVGLADIPTGGAVGKFLENEGGAVGFRPKQAKEIANQWHSDATLEAQRKVQEAQGFGGKFKAAIENPSVIFESAGESVPAMLAGGVAARGLMAATRLGSMGEIAAARGASVAEQAAAAQKGAAMAGAMGEGVMGAGSAAEQIRQETPDGLLTPEQAALAGATGLATTAFGAAGGKLATKLGIGDAETMLAQGAKGIGSEAAQQSALKSVPKAVIQGAISEGLLEELPQSVAEQVLQNLALGKDWTDGVDEAAVMGVLSGGAMGGGAAGLHGAMSARKQTSTPAPADQPAQDPSQPPANQPLGSSLTGTNPADLMSRSADPLAGQISADRLQAEDAAVTRNDFADRNGAMLTGSGLEGSRADPLANMLADNRTSEANTAANIQRAAEKRGPMTATTAANILVASQQQGLEFTVAPHPDGGFLVVPRSWVSPSVAAQSEASLRETLSRVAKVEDAPIQRAARVSTDPVNLDLNTDPVTGYVDNLRAVNTPAAKAFVGEFDAGRLTRQDVEQRMAADRGKTPDERLAEAAAQASTPQEPYSLTAVKPSQSMGLNPAAGPMSSAAVIAVDSGAHGAVRATQPATTGETTNGTQAVQAAPQGSAQPAGQDVKAPRGILAKKAAADAARAAQAAAGQPTAAVDPAAAGRAGVPGADQPGAVQALSGEWQQFPQETGTLNVPRAEMPQVKTAHRGPMVNFLNARGVSHESVEVDPTSLKPTQAEFSQTKVQEAADRDTDRSILISSDGHIIDGHHQALAKLENGKPVRAIRLNATADELIPLVREFPSSTTEQANVQDAAPGAEAQAAAAPVEAPAPARGDAAAAAGLPDAAGGGDIQADGVSLSKNPPNLNTSAQPVQEAAKTAQVEQKPRGVLAKMADQKRQAALDRIAKGTDYFGTKDKADEFITKSGIGDTHEVVQAKAGRFEIREKEAAAPAAAPKPEASAAAASPEKTVRVPADIEAAMAGQMNKQKARIRRLNNEVSAPGMTLADKVEVQTKIKASDATLRKMRQTIFDAEDAAVKAVETRDISAFAEHEMLFPDAYKAIEELIGATPAAAEEKPKGIVGRRTDGVMIREDENGVRYYTEGGVRITETVTMRPTRQGVQVSRGELKPDFMTAEELAASKAPADPATPAPAPAKPDPLTEKEKAAKAKMLGAAAKLADLLSKNTRANITPEQEQKMLPIVIELFEGAMDLGYVKFKQAARYVREFIAGAIDQDAADAIPIDTLQGAYIATARRHADKDITPKREVVSIESIADLDEPDSTAPPAAKTLTESLYQAIRANEMPKDNPALKKLVEAFDGKPADQERMKQAQESLETAIVMVARDMVAKKEGDRTTFDILLRLYERQPNLNIRTSTSIANQAYSTPAPLAYLASRLAGITKTTVVHEPTGGTGMLLIGADPDKAIVNELNDLRIEALKAQGFKPTQKDAATQMLVPEGTQPDAVVTNPPFGSIKDAEGKPIKVKVDGFSLGQIDHLIAARALDTMKEDGRATLILGANKVAGGLSTDDRIFFNWLYSHYNVVGHFEVEGDLYIRQGAGWPVRVITINGRQKSDKFSPVAGTIQRVDNWDSVYEQFTQSLNSAQAPRSRATSSADSAGGRVAAAVATPSQAGGGRPAGGARGAGDVAGAGARAVPDRAKPAAGPVAAVPDEQRLNAQPYVPQPQPGQNPDGAARSAKPAGTASVEEAKGNEFQLPYTPRSSRKDEGVLIPANMAQPTQDALSRLEDEVGDIDEFARKELGYDTVDSLHNALMGLQVDSVATSIHQIKQGKAVVIADQTGIGKGRQAASIIRWAALHGMTPVFVSVKPSLFTDMYGDLADIGTNDVTPFIMNSDAWVAGEGGAKLFANKPTGHKNVIQEIANTGRLPAGSNALFMTYSQINVANVQRQALMALAPNAVFVLDESHNAAGASSTGEFVIGTLEAAKGVVYLSATYAKRPDNMPLYFKTDIGDAAADTEGLAVAMASGGLPLQTVVSNNLVKAGQMFRRERSYDGVSIASVFDSKNRDLHERMSNEATKALRAIVSADRMFHEVYVKQLAEELAASGATVQDSAGNQIEQGVQHTEFSSVVHNFVKQMLLGLKAQSAADEAIASLKRGEKPIIAVENTMGSFLNEYAAANGIGQGESLGTFDYRTVLTRALARSRVVIEVATNGDKVKRPVPMEQLDAQTQAAYKDAQAVIDGLTLNIPVSPIDWMRAEIARAGFKVAEITGRNLSVDYGDPKKPMLSAIDAAEQKDKVNTTREFNSGKLDALILNVAGSTGISLHASEKFEDQRQRHMIVAQAAGDINIFMQMLGRVHRTGQVRLPKYTILSVDLPTEKRPTAVLSIKMKSLNANTSSNTESATSVKSSDILNKYGDQIVDQYLRDNYALARALDLADSIGDDPTEDIARKATGRLALQPIATQHTFYDEVEAQYTALIDYLNKTNQNDLEPRTFDFDAKEIRQEVLFEGPNKATPFGEDAIYGEYSIKAQGTPMKPEEIRATMAEHLGELSPAAYTQKMLDDLDAKFNAYYATLEDAGKDAASVVRNIGRDFLSSHRIGATFRVDINSEPFNAVVLNVRNTHKETGNPYSLSKIQVSVAVNGALRSLSVPATQFSKIEVSGIAPMFKIEQLFKEQPPNQRETAKIITGNLLAAYGEMQGVRGTIITFTKQDGTSEQGILLPKLFDYSKNTRGDYRLQDGAAALKFLQESDNKDIGRFGIMTRDGNVRVLPSGQGIRVQVPKSKLKGAKYFLDKDLIATGGDFVTLGNFMVSNVTAPADAVKVLDLLMKKQALYALPSMADEAKALTGGKADPEDEANFGTKGRGEGSPADRAVMAMAGEGKSADEILRFIANASKSPFNRQVAQRLIATKANPSVSIGGDMGSADGYKNLALYSRKDHEIQLAPEAAYKAEQIFLHEAIHSATLLALDKKSLFGVQMSKLYESVKEQGLAGEYGMKNVGEFVAEAMSNKEFQKKLRDYKATEKSLSEMGLWDRFVTIVRKILGLSQEQQDALSRALELSGGLMRENIPLRAAKSFRAEDAPAFAGVDIAHFGMADAASLKQSALDQIHQSLSHPGKVSVWDKTVGTMRNLAERSPAFKPVFEAAQRFIDDVSMLANEIADVAPRLLPRVESWRDLTKKPVSAEDNKAIGKPLFEGTLMWARDADGKPVLVDDMAKKYDDLSTEKRAKMLMAAGRLDDRVLRMWQGLPAEQFDALVNSRFESQMLKAGVIWSDAELRSLFDLNDQQISLYREARKAIDRSIDLTARADMLRAVGTEYGAMRDVVLEAPTLADARDLLVDTLHADALEDESKADRLTALINTVGNRYESAVELIASGYAPLSRFGRYTVDVVDAAGERQYFGMSETISDANQMADRMRAEFPGATVTQGTMSAEAYKLFAGITPESLELFGNMLGLDAEGGDARDKAFQEYLRLSKNNHSALKRLMHRKGIAGYSEDVGRVLASFTYSNARQAAGGLNAGTVEESINAIPKEQGELKDVAMGLRDYVRDPQEEGQAVRGMLFAQYLGGSVASAFVNMTQPVAVTLPWLSQYGGMKAAGAQLARAVKDMAGKATYEADLQTALGQAEEDGIVSPQEIHQLMAQARGAGTLRSGDGTRAGNARAAASNAWERTKVAWGQPFALAEQFNRRSTFIAAYRLAKERGMRAPAQFARRAVLETQFLYSRANKPRWARGAVGGTLFTFKTYSVSYLELLNRMWTQGGPEGKRAVGWALATVMLMGGAGGLPFMEDLEDLIDGIAQLMGYNVSAKQWRRQALQDIVGKEMADFIDTGVSGLPGAPIDVSGRMGMGDLIPGTGMLLSKPDHSRDLMEVVGPAGDLVSRGFTGARKVLTGDVGGAALELAPSAVRNAAKGIDMAISDRYTDAKGYKVLDTTLPEAAAKLIGFQPRSVAKVQEANGFMMRSKSFYAQTSAEIKAEWARALFEKDDGALQDVRDRLDDWNRKNPDQKIVVKMPDVWKRVREMGKDRAQRIADTAPKALRQEMRNMARETG